MRVGEGGISVTLMVMVTVMVMVMGSTVQGMHLTSNVAACCALQYYSTPIAVPLSPAGPPPPPPPPPPPNPHPISRPDKGADAEMEL